MARFPRFAAVCLPRADGSLARRLLAVAPWLEIHGDLALLDPRGTERIHRDPAGFFAAVRAALAPERARGMALAARRVTAELAARHAARPGADALLVPPGDEALFLSRLPLAVLAVPPRLARRWAPLGLETLGDLAALPAASVETRYGAEGLALHRLARGLDERGLCPAPSREALRVEHACEHPVDRLPHLEPVLAEACARLGAVLAELGEGALTLGLALELDAPERAPGAPGEAAAGPAPVGGRAAAADDAPARWLLELRLPEPEARPALLLDLLRARLAAAPPPRAVRGFVLEAARTRRQDVHQGGLFALGGPVARDAARRREALARAGELLGADAVRPLRPRDAHLPERRWAPADAPPAEPPTSPAPPADPRPAARAASRAAPERASLRTRPADERSPVVLRRHDPPEALVPLLAGGRLVGFRRGRRELTIARLSPPRRLEGGWWSEQPWARDEYELLADDGALYRVGRDLRARRWLLLGELD